MVTLETERLILRMFRDADLEAYGEMSREHVISLIRPENDASIRVAQRLGERFIETIQLLDKPASLYRITRAEWKAQLNDS